MSDTFDTNRDTFLERLKTYNVEVDNTELEPTTQLKALGLEFDLETKQFRLIKWLETCCAIIGAYFQPIGIRFSCRLA